MCSVRHMLCEEPIMEWLMINGEAKTWLSNPILSTAIESGEVTFRKNYFGAEFGRF